MKRRIAVLDIACPACHAKPGIHCKRPSGHRIFGGGEHDSRYNLAEEKSSQVRPPRLSEAESRLAQARILMVSVTSKMRALVEEYERLTKALFETPAHSRRKGGRQ